MISISVVLNLRKPIFSRIPQNPQDLTRSNHHNHQLETCWHFFRPRRFPTCRSEASCFCRKSSQVSFRFAACRAKAMKLDPKRSAKYCKSSGQLRSSKYFQIFLALDTLDGNLHEHLDEHGRAVNDHNQLWTSPSVRPKTLRGRALADFGHDLGPLIWVETTFSPKTSW